MDTKRFLAMACAAAAMLVMLPAATQAQGPLYDKVMVNLPYTVTIGEHVLQPGPYVIRQMDSPGGASRVLLIYSDNGMKFETSAITIPALDNNTPEDTKVMLHHFGPDYYFDKVWIQGKNYGYEFPLPDSVKARERERMAPMTVAATYQAVPAETKQEETTTAERSAPAPEPAPAPQETAQAQPAPEPAPAAEPAPAPAPQEAAPAPMPATASGWLMMLLSGGALSSAGLMLRRRK